jgi:MraZ protein
MFRGRHEQKVDPKGRIALPARFREVLAGRFDDTQIVITKHLTDPCLVVYPLAEWEKFEARIAALSQFDPTMKLIRRLLVGRAQDVTLDKQGRLLVPPDLRKDAELDTEVVWQGQIQYAELWSAAHYSKEVVEAPAKLDASEMSALESALAKLGI